MFQEISVHPRHPSNPCSEKSANIRKISAIRVPKKSANIKKIRDPIEANWKHIRVPKISVISVTRLIRVPKISAHQQNPRHPRSKNQHPSIKPCSKKPATIRKTRVIRVPKISIHPQNPSSKKSATIRKTRDPSEANWRSTSAFQKNPKTKILSKSKPKKSYFYAPYSNDMNPKNASVLLFTLLFTVLSCSKKENPTVAPKDLPRNEAEAGIAMQQFVSQISKYSKAQQPGFNIVPQNGSSLAYTNLDPKQGKNYQYIQSVDGFGVEELFYTEDGSIDSARVAVLDALKNDRKVLVSEFVPDSRKIEKIVKLNNIAGFVPFIRMKSNYNYSHIPEKIRNQNQDDVTDMDKVRNYLYLINPKEFDNKEAYLKALSETNFDLLIIDLFYDMEQLTKSDLARLKTKADGGKRLVICYLNIGSAEKWRYYWNKSWKIGKPTWIKKNYDGYEGEFYVEFWNPEWKGIVFRGADSYLKKIINSGFDGAYLDNTEAYHYLYHDPADDE